ncbi:MAG TPA: hypothetical protein VLG72_05475 [Nitrospirota bacterium]|nr:hypothetical protein [Nitrospirota bacterium]
MGLSEKDALMCRKLILGLRRAEKSFLKAVEIAERVPPEVLEIAFVIAHYWDYLDQLGAD